jgi:hypothetical protein
MSKPITGEPTHEDEDGNEKPGPIDLKSTITADKAAEAEAISAEHYADADKRNRYSAMNPQIAEPHSPLDTLIIDALREYGEMNPNTLVADSQLLFIRLANKVVEDYRSHYYSDMPDMDYYVSMQETRQIPDVIMLLGLQHYYALQQASEKAKLKAPEYYQRLNQTLYNRKFGNGPIEIQPYD